jgi:hypothetical protein
MALRSCMDWAVASPGDPIGRRSDHLTGAAALASLLWPLI